MHDRPRTESPNGDAAEKLVRVVIDRDLERGFLGGEIPHVLPPDGPLVCRSCEPVDPAHTEHDALSLAGIANVKEHGYHVIERLAEVLG